VKKPDIIIMMRGFLGKESLSKSVEDALEHHGQNDLHSACRQGRPLRIVRKIAMDCPGYMMEVDECLKTPLHLATESVASKKVIEYLVAECGKTVSMQDSEGATPLHILCKKKNCLSAVRKMVDACPDSVAIVDNFHQTPLHVATKYSSLEVIDYLIQEYSGAAAARDDSGKTPLHNLMISIPVRCEEDTSEGFDNCVQWIIDMERCNLACVAMSLCNAAPISVIVKDDLHKRPVDYAMINGGGDIIVDALQSKTKTVCGGLEDAYIKRRRSSKSLHKLINQIKF